MATLPEQIDNVTLETNLIFEDYATYTYYVDPTSMQIRGFCDDHIAMVQAARIHLNTPRYRHQILTPNAGFEFDGLVGGQYGYVVSEIKRRVVDCLKPDTRFISVDGWQFDLEEDGTLTVFFILHTVFGDEAYEMSINTSTGRWKLK